MDIYSATINLSSKNNNQVRRTGLTAAEIMILRAIHGDPSRSDTGGHAPVVDIVRTGEVERTGAQERERLIGGADDGLGVSLYRKEQYRKVFPNDWIDIPDALKPSEFTDSEEFKALRRNSKNQKITPSPIDLTAA